MEPDLSNSLRMSDDDEEKNNETSKGGSGKRRTTRNESEKRRRDKLNIYINELASMVPTCAASQKKLDKTTILKMTVNYMRIHNDLTGSVLGKEYGLHMSFLSSGEVASLLDESLNGFMFVLSRTGEIVYMSQSITPLLGYEVDQIVGRNLIDFIHPEDKPIILYELREDNKDFIMESDFNGLHKINSKPVRHSFDVRIGCASDEHFTNNQDSFEMVHVTGYTDIWETKKTSKDAIVSRREEQGEIFTEKPRCLVAVGLLTRPGLKRFASVNESTQVEFESRHTMDGKFLFVDPRSITLTGFWPYELLGTSLYSYVHHDDMQMLSSVHQLLLEYGECKTEPYRMRSKGDQWLWMKSRSFISYNHWNSKPEFFCSTNVAVCNKDGMQSLRERKKASQCDPHSVHTSIVPVRNNSTMYPPYKNQQEASLMAPGMAVQQDNVVKRNAACREEVVPVMNDLSSTNVPPVNSANSTDGKHMSTEESESQQQSCEDGDADSTDSLDLTMSYEELENFIEAQGQLHDQLMMKHAVLEETINKQKQQLQAVQQQMLLNLQAQLTINPGANQELFEEQFKRTKRVSEMHEKQEATQKELVQTLKEKRRQTEKRNQRQLKYYLEKRMKVTSDASSLPQATQTTDMRTIDMRMIAQQESLNNVVNVTVLEEKCTMNSVASMHEHYVSTDVHRQVENIREGIPNKVPLPPSALPQRTVQYSIAPQQDAKQRYVCYAPDGRQPIADGQLLSTAPGMASSFISQQEPARDFQTSQQSVPVYPSVQELEPQGRPQSFTALAEKTNLPNLFPAGGFTSGSGEPPTTLSNIQSLLTASSQNPESMQKLLSGLSSQPDVAQTLLGLLKQAQASGSSEQDSLLFDKSLQRTTNQFSSALGTDGNSSNNAPNMYQFENIQGLQKQQNSLRATSMASARRNVGKEMQARSRPTSSRSSTSTWSGMSTGDPSAVGSPFLQQTGQTPRKQAMERRVNEKQKDGNKKDYFSNFSSQELEAMFLTAAPKPPPRFTAQSSNSVEEAKLREEQLLHSPLLVQQQQLLQMHQDQRKQLLVRQQEQLLMANQKHDPTQQQMNVSFAEDSQQDSLRALLSDTNHPSTSTREQDQPSTSHPAVGQSSASWDSLTSSNFELNEADEQVLNMLLAESSMDTLLDPSPWPDTDNLLDYLNMNPDLTSD